MDHLGNLGKEALTIVAIPLGTNNLPGLVSNLASNAINTFERKISGQRAVKAGKELTLFISNEELNKIRDKSVSLNMFRIQYNKSIKS